MDGHDRLPPDLRRWAAAAALPWSAASLLRIWQRALRDTGCPQAACARLDAAEARRLARDAAAVWGNAYPAQRHPFALSGNPRGSAADEGTDTAT